MSGLASPHYRDLWLDCLSERDIAKQIDVPRKTINEWLGEMEKLPQFLEPPKSRQHFDIWQFQPARLLAAPPPFPTRSNSQLHGVLRSSYSANSYSTRSNSS
jgi:hypothetical protein